jgi:hypothetical protein
MTRPIAKIAAIAVRCGGILLLLAAAVPAAQAQWKGELSSSVLTPLPARPAFDVVIYDDSEQNLAFRRAFLDALARSGHATGDSAAYVFSFATGITWKAKRAQEVQSERIRKYPVERGETTVPVGREAEAAADPDTRMFGDRRTTPPLIAPHIGNAERDRLDISVTLRERASGKVMWIADLALPLLQDDRARIVRSIIGPIIGAIGRNADHEPFEVK